MAKLTQNYLKVTKEQITFVNSGSNYILSTSASSVAQIWGLTCSADINNSLCTTSSLSGYFTLPLISKSISDSYIQTDLNIIYTTESIVLASSSNPDIYFQPTSSEDKKNYNLLVEILRNDSANDVAVKTYNSINNSNVTRFITPSYTGGTPHVSFTLKNRGPINNPFLSASGFSYNIVQSGSYGSGSSLNYNAPEGTFEAASASLVIGRELSDNNSFHILSHSSSFGGTEDRIAYYISSSGKIGIGTTDPKNDFDIKANTFKIRSVDGTKEIEFGTDGQLKTRKFAGGAGAETTGSELVLSYSPGTFEVPVKATRGDIMGTIRWEDESFGSSGSREAGTPMKIEGEIIESDGSGIAGAINFYTGNPSFPSAVPRQVVSMKHQQVDITGSLVITSHITSSGNISSSGHVEGKITAHYATGSHTTIGTTATGDILKFGNVTTTAGHIYVLKDGVWSNTDADATNTSTGSLAVAVGTNSTTHGMLLRGMVKLDHATSANIGSPLYLSTTANELQQSPPTDSGETVRVCGYQISGSTNGDTVFFTPDNTWVTLS